MPLFSPAFLGGSGEGTGIGFREKERGGNGEGTGIGFREKERGGNGEGTGIEFREKERGGNGEGTGFFFLLAPELEPPTTSERPLIQRL